MFGFRYGKDIVVMLEEDKERNVIVKFLLFFGECLERGRLKSIEDIFSEILVRWRLVKDKDISNIVFWRWLFIERILFRFYLDNIFKRCNLLEMFYLRIEKGNDEVEEEK